MSLLSKTNLKNRIRRSREARAKLVSSNLDKGIAYQIRGTRDKRGWNQTELAEAVGMRPNNVSRLESPDYGKHTISSLKRIADALDVALVVRFVPFSQYINWLSGTPQVDFGLSPETMAVPSFDEEEKNSEHGMMIYAQNLPINGLLANFPVSRISTTAQTYGLTGIWNIANPVNPTIPIGSPVVFYEPENRVA